MNKHYLIYILRQVVEAEVVDCVPVTNEAQFIARINDCD